MASSRTTRKLKAELLAKQRHFESQTDTEVIAHLLTDLLGPGSVADRRGGGGAEAGCTAPSPC